MSKLVEGEVAPRSGAPDGAPSLAVQFFLIPLAVVAVLVSLYAGFRMLVADQRTAQDYLNELRTGGRQRQWPAAYELSRLLADQEVEQREPELGGALVRAFQESAGGDPRVRRYLAMAIGQLQVPPAETIPVLLGATGDADSETVINVIWALGSLEARSAVAPLQQLYGSADAGIRKMVVYTLGALPDDGQLRTLRTALNDTAVDVQWNAAVALARHGDPGGVDVLRRMLDREYVERAVSRTPRRDVEPDPVADVMISGIRAASALRAAILREPVLELSREDHSLRVRQAAIEALKEIGT